jgi:hypothetical protein
MAYGLRDSRRELFEDQQAFMRLLTKSNPFDKRTFNQVNNLMKLYLLKQKKLDSIDGIEDLLPEHTTPTRNNLRQVRTDLENLWGEIVTSKLEFLGLDYLFADIHSFILLVDVDRRNLLDIGTSSKEYDNLSDEDKLLRARFINGENPSLALMVANLELAEQRRQARGSCVSDSGSGYSDSKF